MNHAVFIRDVLILEMSEFELRFGKKRDCELVKDMAKKGFNVTSLFLHATFR
jgi:hypothetical protein